MNRCKDYACFIIWFAGLSYMALWPLSAHGVGGIGLGGDWELPPTLHVIGLAAAVFVNIKIVQLVLARFRKPRAAQAEPNPLTPDLVAARLNVGRWKAPSAQTVKPREQFGLRGTER